MKSFGNGTNKIGPLLLIFLWIFSNINAQSSSYYRHEFFQPIAQPSKHYFRRSTGFEPINYSRDLASEESKHKISPKKYSKPIPSKTSFLSDEDDFSLERFHSGEYSSEARNIPNSAEQDSREYTIGTQIHVQHPITVPKKITSSPYSKPTKQSLTSSEYQSSSSDSPSALPLKKRPTKFNQHHYDAADPFHVIPPPKTTSPGFVSKNNNDGGYHVYEPDYDDYKPPKKSREHFKTDFKNDYKNDFKSVASKKQIEQYIEDQQKKLLDEVLKTQLLNNPEFKQFLKQKERQRFEREHRQLYNEEEGIISPPNPPPSVFLENLEEGITFTTNRPRRRPSDFKRSPKRPGTLKPKRKFRSAVVIEV